MIEGCGLIAYCNGVDMPFYGILSNKSSIEATQDYEKMIEFLFGQFSHRVAIMGIGSDGHIAGIPARFKNYDLRIKNQELVEYFDDFPGEQKERITLTFKALEHMTQLIVLAFGEDKKEALEKMLTSGSEKEIPARFYTRPEVAKKTLLITDQKI